MIEEQLFQAYYDARKNKRQKPDALAFEMDYEQKLLELAREIENFRYYPGPSTCFIVEKPVKREVFAASFRDRIVHHFIYNAINGYFDRRFINDSYSCRVGKGTLYGIRRLEHFIRSCSQNHQKDCYILKLDLKGYFMSINRAILFAKLKKGVDRMACRHKEVILDLLYKTVFYDPLANYTVAGSSGAWQNLPKSKSLFYAKPGCGLPIGNLTSQLFGNIYLNDFDHFVKGKLKCRYYGRYVDDFFIIHHSRFYLKSLIPQIRHYLNNALAIDLHKRKIYLQHSSKGVKFLGAVIKPYRTYISNQCKGNFHSKINKWNKAIARDKPDEDSMEKIIACSNSYLGLIKHHNAHKLRRKFFDNFTVYFWNYAYIDKRFLKTRECIASDLSGFSY